LLHIPQLIQSIGVSHKFFNLGRRRQNIYEQFDVVCQDLPIAEV
jgi:hypothetical protein